LIPTRPEISLHRRYALRNDLQMNRPTRFGNLTVFRSGRNLFLQKMVSPTSVEARRLASSSRRVESCVRV
ncbi:MAG: hypothetical protein Q4C70_10670, partial [Planctomycetia bacterium]|nr:hypothetical protein [Planctomycetia bacterium]